MTHYNNLQGGSTGMSAIAEYNSNKTFLRILQDTDKRPVFISGKSTLHHNFVILPAFDYTMSRSDSGFRTSVAPYRLDHNYTFRTGEGTEVHQAFSSFYIPFWGINYYGNIGCSWVSPKTVAAPGEPYRDPLEDVIRYVKEQGASCPLYDYIDKNAMRQKFGRNVKDPLPAAQMMVLLNVLCTPTSSKAPDQTFGNNVLLLKKSSLDKLQADLNKLAVTGTKPRDPNYPMYTFGDPTDPERALWTSVETYKPNPANPAIEVPYLAFGTPTGPGKFSVKEYKISEQELAGRLDLTDCNNVLKIHSYDEIVAYLVEDGCIPYEILTAALEPYTNNIPPKPVRKQTYPGQGKSEQQNALAPMMYNVPQPPAPAPAPPAPPVEEPMFWVVKNGQTVAANLTQVQAMADAGKDVACMKQGEEAEGWKKVSTYVTVRTSVPQPPAPAPAPSPVPAPPADEKSNARTPEEEAEYNELLAKAMRQELVDDAEIDRLNVLSQKDKA